MGHLLWFQVVRKKNNNNTTPSRAPSFAPHLPPLPPPEAVFLFHHCCPKVSLEHPPRRHGNSSFCFPFSPWLRAGQGGLTEGPQSGVILPFPVTGGEENYSLLLLPLICPTDNWVIGLGSRTGLEMLCEDQRQSNTNGREQGRREEWGGSVKKRHTGSVCTPGKDNVVVSLFSWLRISTKQNLKPQSL